MPHVCTATPSAPVEPADFTKLCRDCRHMWQREARWSYREVCGLTGYEKRDVVTGRKWIAEWSLCNTERGQGRPCGPSGKLFSPKTEVHEEEGKALSPGGGSE